MEAEGNVSYIYANDIFGKKFLNTYVSMGELRELIVNFTETGSIMQ